MKAKERHALELLLLPGAFIIGMNEAINNRKNLPKFDVTYAKTVALVAEAGKAIGYSVCFNDQIRESFQYMEQYLQ